MEYIRDPEMVAELVKEYELWQYFTDIDSYMEYLRIFRAGKRACIFEDAQRKQEIYILLSGKVKVCTILNSGRQLLLDYYEKVDLFGEFILTDIIPEQSNHFYTETVTPVLGLVLHVTPVKERLLNDVRFLRFYINRLQHRFIQLGNAQPMNVLNSSERNVAGYIWSKLSRQAEQGQGPFYFSENLREVSELMGISYRQLHRVLRKLVEKGILTRTAQGYLVSDKEGLLQIVERE